MITNDDFQTPEWVCDIMVSLIDGDPKAILEPTPGQGNMVKSIRKRFHKPHICSPACDFLIFSTHIPFDYVIANPPFTPMRLGYQMLEHMFDFSTEVITIMPWLTIINSEKRSKWLVDRGLQKIIHLPRRAFKGSRVQTCILKFTKDYEGDIIFKLWE